MKKGKAISTVALTAPTVRKINAVKSKVSSGFAKLSHQDIVEAVFRQSADAIIKFVNGANETVATTETTAPVTKRNYRKKVKQLDPTRRKMLREELVQNNKVTVSSTKEAASLYNYFKTKGRKVKYTSTKRNGIVVEFA